MEGIKLVTYSFKKIGKIYMKIGTILSLFYLLSIFNLKSQTVIQSGDVFGDWFLSGSPYYIEGDIHLPSDERLRIWPGVQVVFTGQFGFEVEGKLDATGNYNDSITFTYADTTGFSEGSYLGWNGISFIGYNYSFADSSKMAYCNIEFSGSTGMTCVAYPYMVFNNSEIRYNKYSGLVLFDFSDIIAQALVVRNNNAEGIVSLSSSPQVSNFVIRNNKGTGLLISGNGPGGLYSMFLDGKIQGNTSLANGGGVAIDVDAYAYFENVEITENKAVTGGGIYCGMANLDLRSVIISGNSADNGGGLFGDSFSNISIEYATIHRNRANYAGGGASVYQGEFNLNHCTICANSSGEFGGGIVYNCDYSAQSNIQNSIIWDNNPGPIEVLGNGPIVSYSDINGGYNGIQNIDANPLFVDPLNNDFHLSWTNYPEDNGFKSPCIDAGDPGAMQDPDGTSNDMGAYYFDQGVFTAMNEDNFDENILVYPNPAQNVIKLSNMNGAENLAIYNLTGKIILTRTVDVDLTDIDISAFDSGVYFIKIYTKNESVITKKIIKK
jgi:hypothetical protein